MHMHTYVHVYIEILKGHNLYHHSLENPRQSQSGLVRMYSEMYSKSLTAASSLALLSSNLAGGGDCVCVCIHVYVCVCERESVRVCVCVFVRVYLCVCRNDAREGIMLPHACARSFFLSLFLSFLLPLPLLLLLSLSLSHFLFVVASLEVSLLWQF